MNTMHKNSKKSPLQEGPVKRRPREVSRKTGLKVKQELLHAQQLFREMYHPDKIAKTKGKSSGKNKRNGTKKNSKPSQDSFMKKLLRESEEFTYYTPYVRKISFSERKKINLNNTIPQIYLNTDKKSKITIRNNTKEKLEDLKPIFGNLDSAINSLYDFFLYIEYCVVKGNDAK